MVPALSETTRGLLDALLDGTGPPLITVCAPTGYGKSTVLNALVKELSPADHVVWGPVELAGDPPGADRPVVLVVDDADRLPAGQLARMRELVAGNKVRAVVAHRPGPALSTDIPTRTVTLGPLGVGEVANELRRRTLPPEHAERVHAFTGGVPRYVDWVLAACTVDLDETERRAAERLRLADATARLLIALDAGGPDLLGDVLDLDDPAAAIASARADALVDPAGRLFEIVRRALPSALRPGVLLRLGRARLRAGLPVHRVAEVLAAHAVPAPDVFVAGAREVAGDLPGRAAALFAAAARAGAPVGDFEIDWARAAALSGEFATALRLSDAMLVSERLDIRLAGAEVAAAVLAHNAELAGSAQVSRWAAHGPARHHAVIGLIGTGRPGQARNLLNAPDPDAAPTSTAGMSARMATGIEQSISAPAAHALSTLLGAAALESGQAHLAPDSPAALAAIVAIHAGEPDLALAVLHRARDAHPMAANRHRILLAWLAMAKGDLGAATVDTVGRLSLRDELFAAGLAVGLARRGGDLPALRERWRHAYHVVMRVQVDLFSLLPVGEIVVAAARLGESARLVPHVHQAEELLDRLGNPPLWTVLFSWQRFHAAIIVKDDEQTGRALRELEWHAGTSRYSATLHQAARCWNTVLAGGFAASPVIDAADALLACGLRWEAASLAAQAALRTPDRPAMITLLETARRLQGRHRSVGPLRTVDVLSARERDVAGLVSQGLTYKQIGGQLFISAKTVEHHVAKIRAKLGATSRQELLRTLRELFDEE